MAWVVGVDSRISFSPFRYCNGTPRATLLDSHTIDYLPTNPAFVSPFFIDFAGSGTVHLLGELFIAAAVAVVVVVVVVVVFVPIVVVCFLLFNDR